MSNALYNIEAEISVIGASMVSQSAKIKTLELLTPESFYDERHKKIFAAIKKLNDDNTATDLITLSNQLGAEFSPYLAEINGETPNISNTEQHCYILLEKHLKRQHIEIANELLDEAQNDNIDALESTDRFLSKLRQLDNVKNARRLETMKDAILKYALHVRQVESGEKAEFSTGVTKLDQRCKYRQGELTYVVARPSAGKSALMIIGAIANANAGHRVGIISLEMLSRNIGRRAYRYYSNGEEFSEQGNDGYLATELDILIDARAGLNMNDISGSIDDMVRQGCKLIFLDYSQIIKAGGGKTTDELSKICNQLQVLCKTYDIALVALAQMNRESENNAGKRPSLATIKGSGAFEETGRLIIAIHNMHAAGIERDAKGRDTRTIREVGVLKQNEGGQTGWDTVGFDGATGSFYELPDDDSFAYYEPQ